ncbi:MAG TPA: hypothetical protein PK400_06040 [Phycisphaerales bacterium]|nr:hypothetical protein [Phycisphaerales bacterium]HRQ76447.1 hypothetical protein [Phycisphaerales bacterium]
MSVTGLEHDSQSLEKSPCEGVGSAESGAHSAQLILPVVSTDDPALAGLELRQIIDAWPTLPVAIRAGIVAMVNAAQGTPSAREGGRP